MKILLDFHLWIPRTRHLLMARQRYDALVVVFLVNSYIPLMKQSQRFLMVCTGNICRSPTADGVMRTIAEQQGLEDHITVDSAGIQGYHAGEAPDPRSVEHAAQRGYDLSALVARKVTTQDFTDFDMILAMDRSHLLWLVQQKPIDAPAQLKLFMPDESEVADPYYGGAQGFETVLDQIEAGVDYWLSQASRN